ncbi:hypothetical protein Lepto7375DRAFT_0291 [Leptolyngbya sp. PCC 7375]|nr:hypothetical protein Lepto7375DRAFT_0291 [Leptolyngbya sp. PCC 7375]
MSYLVDHNLEGHAVLISKTIVIENNVLNVLLRLFLTLTNTLALAGYIFPNTVRSMSGIRYLEPDDYSSPYHQFRSSYPWGKS